MKIEYVDRETMDQLWKEEGMNPFRDRAIEFLSEEMGYTQEVLRAFSDKLEAGQLSNLEYAQFDPALAVRECTARLAAEDRITTILDTAEDRIRALQAEIKELKQDRFALMRVNTMAGQIILNDVETLRTRIKELEAPVLPPHET